MSFVFELPGSELRDVIADGTTVRLRFAVVAARNEADERGWLTSVHLELSGAALYGDTTHAFGKIAEGRLRQNDHDAAPLGVPGALAGDLELALHVANGTNFVVRGQALVTSVADGARFSPDL